MEEEDRNDNGEFTTATVHSGSGEDNEDTLEDATVDDEKVAASVPVGSGSRGHLPPSKNIKVKCVICKKNIVKQNMKDHAKTVHKTSEAEALGQKSVFDMFAKKLKAPHIESKGSDTQEIISNVDDNQTDFNQNILVETEQQGKEVGHRSTENLQPPNKVRIVSVSSSACWTKEEKEDLFKQIQALNMKMSEMEINNAGNKAKDAEAAEDILGSCNDQNIVDRARSIAELVDAFVELSDNKEENFVCCVVCNPPDQTPNIGTPQTPRPGVFFYTEDMLDNFQTSILPQNFRNFKKSLRRHFSTTGHSLALKTAKTDFENNQKFVRKTEEAGMRCGRWLYHIFSKGRPYSDYPDLISTDIMNGTYCGNINHSEKFPPAVLPYMAEAIKQRKVQFLTQPLDQTGHRVPIKIVADKDTLKHRTRQLVLVITIVPDSPNLIQAVYLGHPVVEDHSGPGVADNLIAVVENCGIKSEQVEGQSYDGQYFHLSVHTQVQEHFGLLASDVQDDWDAMHKCGLVDKAVRKIPDFKWLVDLTQTISDMFGLVNWGKMYEELMKACENLEMELANPKTWSNTKFANYAHRVYLSMTNDFPALLDVLKKIQHDRSNSKAKERADNAEHMERKISNKKFAIMLCGVTDIYKVFGQIVGVLQSVNSLPFQRYDRFINLLKVLESMSNGSIADHSKCFRDNCLWPNLHHREPSIVQGAWDNNTKLKSNHETSIINYTRQAKIKESEHAVTDPVMRARVDLELLCKELLKRFKERVYDCEDVKVIEHSRTVADLSSLSLKIRNRSPVLISLLEGPAFVESSVALARSLRVFDKDVILRQFAEFVKKLELITKDLSDEELKDMDSKDLIVRFFNSEDRLFSGIELVMQAIAVACIKVSVESIAESFISEYNRRNDKLRTLSEDAAHFEMEIAKNGPVMAECDAVVRESLNLYFGSKSKSKKWNFITKSGAVDGKLLGKRVSKILGQSSRFPFMK